MANAHSFPLLNLPNLAREHVVKVMGVREQYLFATLSKKSKSAAKNGVRHLSYDTDWTFSIDHVTIGLKKTGTKTRQIIAILSSQVKDIVIHHHIQLRAEDMIETSIEQLAFLNDVFKFSLFDLYSCSVPINTTKRILAAVDDLKVGIDRLEVGAEEPDNEMFIWVMDNYRYVKRLTNDCKTTADFQWDSQEPFTNEYLSLYHAPWLTMDHLTRLFMNCRLFEIGTNKHQLTVNDLNQLVKMWMNDSKIEFLQIGTGRNFDFRGVMQNIEKEPIQPGQEIYIENLPRTIYPGEAYKIRQKCGKEAVVWKSLLSGFTISTHFDNPRCDFWDVYERNDDDNEVGEEEQNDEEGPESDGDEDSENEDEEESEEEEDDKEEEDN